MTQRTLTPPEAPSREAAWSDKSTSPPATFASVLVGVDGTSTGRDAIALGEILRHPDGRMTLAHVVLAQGPIYRNFHSTPVGQHAHEMLEAEAVVSGVSAELTGMFAPSVGSGLHQLTEDCGADLLVVGSCRRGPLGRLLRGDDTRGSLSGASSAVAVAPLGYADRPRQIDTVGVGYDGSPESKGALEAARRLAVRHDATVRALTVIWPTAVACSTDLPASRGAWAAMTFEPDEQAASQQLRALTGVVGSVTVGPPADELLRFGDQVDVLVVGSRGRGPLRRTLLGSTSAHLARSARCPVLVVPRGAHPVTTDDAGPLSAGHARSVAMS